MLFADHASFLTSLFLQFPAPLIGDLIYGPILNYLTLSVLSKKPNVVASPGRESETLVAAPLIHGSEVFGASIPVQCIAWPVFFWAELTRTWRGPRDVGAGVPGRLVDRLHYLYKTYFPMRQPDPAANCDWLTEVKLPRRHADFVKH